MTEQAFRVEKDSNFYNDYYKAKQEKQKFHGFARAFFDKHDLLQKGKYCLAETLSIEMTQGQRKQYETQIKKYVDANGMTVFKKNSAMQKEWYSDVVGNVDIPVMDKMRFWWMPYIMRGSYSLWDYDGDIYGLLTSKSDEQIKLSEFMIPIKMSEYYAVIEQSEEAT